MIHRGARANAVIASILLVAAALGAICIPRAWEKWTESALGLWLAGSPWVLGYAAFQGATASAFVGGLVVVVLALWVLTTEKDAGQLGNNPAACGIVDGPTREV